MIRSHISKKIFAHDFLTLQPCRPADDMTGSTWTNHIERNDEIMIGAKVTDCS